MPEVTEEKFKALLGGLDPAAVLRATSKVYHWNTLAIEFPALHHVVGKVVQFHDSAGKRACLPEMARDVIEGATSLLVEERRRSADAMRRAAVAPAESDTPVELALLFQARASIVNPGTGWQMLNYVLDKYAKPDSALPRVVGISSRDLVFFAVWLLGRVDDLLSDFADLDAPFANGSELGLLAQERIKIPPNSFLDAWDEVTTFGPDRDEDLRQGGLDPKVISFLSAHPEEFGPGKASVARYAFVREEGEFNSLLCPILLPETILYGVRQGILDALAFSNDGTHGNEVGEAFQSIVRTSVIRRWKLTPEENVQRDPNFTDADLLARVPGFGDLLMECKGSGQRPQARWGDPQTLLGDLRRDVQKGADQASKAISTLGEKADVKATLIITESYFPGLTMAIRALPKLESLLAKLPRPLVVNCFQLDYLLSRISPEDLGDFLDWRAEEISRGKLVPHDEFDSVRAYKLKDLDGPFKFARDLGAIMMPVGGDDDYETSTRMDLGYRLLGTSTPGVPKPSYSEDRTT